MRGTLTATALVMALMAAACASDGSSVGSGGYGGGGSSAASPMASPTATSTESGGGRYGYGNGGGGSGGGGGGGPVAGSVVVANYSFTPSTVQVKSGATIEIQNSTPQTPHTFTVTGEDIDLSLDPQSTTKVTIVLPPGTYPFICRFHSSLGMKGSLVVT